MDNGCGVGSDNFYRYMVEGEEMILNILVAMAELVAILFLLLIAVGLLLAMAGGILIFVKEVKERINEHMGR